MSPEETFNFMVTTDNHLGFKHSDCIRGEDSFDAFEEALSISRDKDVDFILLGGDLFHVNRPSAIIEHKCIQIIRQHMNAPCRRGTSFKLISGKFCHFEKVQQPNFADPHLTVPYPILTIHGNHDDPTGPTNQSICEKLATCGLINYFGLPLKSQNKITIEPIILQKGSIKLALYGLGFIPDQKLKAAFMKDEVTFTEPPEGTFNILVVHQNRVKHSEEKHIPDSIFPKYFHLIIRGHEHDSIGPDLLPDSDVGGLVYQPGSTVATSLGIPESGAKKIGLFKIRASNVGDSIKYSQDYEIIPLEICRPMLFKDITQKEIFKHIKSKKGACKLTPDEYQSHTKAYVKAMIEDLLEENEFMNDSDNQKRKRFKPSTLLPLLRVRVEVKSRKEQFEPLEVSSSFYPDKVANSDVILFKKQKIIHDESGEEKNITFDDDNRDDEDEYEDIDFVDLSTEKRDTIESAVKNYFLDKPKNEQLQVLSINEYVDAIRGSLEDGNVVSKVVKTKKLEVMHMFYSELTTEETAEAKFHDIEKVEKWFLQAFQSNKSFDDEIFMDL